jgi:hypothetical protein
MFAPTLMLWLYAIALGIASVATPNARGLPKRADLASSVAFPLIVASWVMADARKRGRRLCHDYDSFVYFAWPLVVPVYLFQTRGSRALLTLREREPLFSWEPPWLPLMTKSSNQAKDLPFSAD